MGVDHLVIKGFGIFTLFVVLAAKDLGITKITQPSSISNAPKKSTDVIIDTEAATKQEPKLVSQLEGKGTRRIEVQRPVIEDGADDAREYEEMGDDSQATDVLNEVRGQERNKEEIFDTIKQYKAEKEIQDSRRPGLSKMKAQVDSP
ncbi:PREDICTED: uncharacterized protein LOC107357170 [Acropora digitifera]|uniref:uncharacterized protein LOC107357170 n=1 Tax=Acropora digitifera TaxID=70779 RepID=UPI00077AFF66|nr:PREDICTED: uncharacterized protein LOC107357170 [Acropora digitifera]